MRNSGLGYCRFRQLKGRAPMRRQRIWRRAGEELRPWLAVKAGTEREQMYVDAVRAMYEGYPSVPGSKRWQEFPPRSHGATSDKVPR